MIIKRIFLTNKRTYGVSYVKSMLQNQQLLASTSQVISTKKIHLERKRDF